MNFSATFGGWHRATIFADNCADDNDLANATRKSLEIEDVDIKVKDLIRSRDFEMAESLPNSKPTSSTCNMVVTGDTELNLHHGSPVTLRGVRWLITEKAVRDPLTGRPVLEALGNKTRDILAATAENHSGVVYVSELPTAAPLPKEKGIYSSKACTILMVASTTLTGMKTIVGSPWVPRTQWRNGKHSNPRLRRPRLMACPPKASSNSRVFSVN